MFLYLATDGLIIKKLWWRFIIQAPDQWEQLLDNEIPISLVEGIVIFGKIQLTTDTIRACLQGKIPVFFLSKTGNIFWKLDSLEIRNVELLYSHIRASLDPEIALQYSKTFILSKIKNSKVMLQRRKRFYSRDDLDFSQTFLFFDTMGNQVREATSLESLRGYEWVAAVSYFESFAKFIPFPFEFKGKNRRPPKDPVNSMLSLGYTLLAQTVQMVLSIQGIDPQIWFFHAPKDLKTLLVLDVMEMFRAWIVDDLIIRLLTTNKIQISDFIINSDDDQHPCLMSDEWLKVFIDAYYQTIFKEKNLWDMDFNNNYVKLKIIEQTIEDFKQTLVSETYNYEGFKIR